MSLINDALRRAKQAHQETAPTTTPPDPHFRPVDPAIPTRRGLGLLLPALLGVVVLLGLFLLWELAHGDSSATSSGPLAVAARTPAPAAVSPRPAAVASPAWSASGMVNPTPAAVLHPAPEPLSNPAAPESTNKTTVAGQSDTNQPAAAEPVAPAAPPLKLQGITYNPRRPSAMINGRVIFLGDRVREYRVLSIRSDEVVLVGAGRTNILSLEP